MKYNGDFVMVCCICRVVSACDCGYLCVCVCVRIQTGTMRLDNFFQPFSFRLEIFFLRCIDCLLVLILFADCRCTLDGIVERVHNFKLLTKFQVIRIVAAA